MNIAKKLVSSTLSTMSVAIGFMLAGCADSLAGMSLPSMPKLDDINPFAEKPVPLAGKRVAVILQ